MALLFFQVLELFSIYMDAPVVVVMVVMVDGSVDIRSAVMSVREKCIAENLADKPASAHTENEKKKY